MTNTNYRMIISYSESKTAFIAQAPELPGCVAEGATREEAIRKLEEEMAAQVENIAAQGLPIPEPIDAQDFNGNLTVKVSSTLHRDLAFMAKQEEVEIETLLVELLTRGVNQRWMSRGRQQRPEGRGGRMQEGQGSRYHGIMENRADFIEYVRSLETAGQRNSNSRGGGRRPRR